MIRHFLGVFFWSFISLVVFVNLFQFSGAVLPFYEANTGVQVPIQNTIFGFSSIITFVQTIGTDEGISTGLDMFSLGIRFVQMFSVDDFATFFKNMMNINNPSQVVLNLLFGLFNLIKDILVLPIMVASSMFMCLLGALVFAWNLLSIFFNFILGYYNTPLVAVGNLPNAYMSAYAFY